MNEKSDLLSDLTLPNLVTANFLLSGILKLTSSYA